MKSTKLSPRQKLAQNSKRDPITNCLIWQGGKATNGYGITTTTDGKPISAHRLAWILENGPIPATYKGRESVIEHVCSVSRACINPEHLRLSNQQQNLAHPVTKARKKAAAKRRGPAVTDAQLAEIHTLMDSGKTGYEIAKLTSRSESHISTIRRRYETKKKQEAQTAFIKETNRRLADLLFPKKPSGGAPESGDRRAA